MTQQNLAQLLIELNACDEAKEWAADKTWQEVYATCRRGDWLLWLYAKTNSNDLMGITLAKGHCANTVRHLMKDSRSIAAVDAAINYGQGKIGKKELDAAAADAFAAAVAADAFTFAAATAALAAADAFAFAAAASAAANAFAAAVAALAAADAAKAINQQQTADIVRYHLPIEKWNI